MDELTTVGKLRVLEAGGLVEIKKADILAGRTKKVELNKAARDEAEG